MSDPLTTEVTDAVGDQARGRSFARALAPFRSPAYRKLALALVASSFANGVWIVALVWEVIRTGGGPGHLSIVSTSAAVGVVLPALLGGVVADRVPQKTILLGVGVVELAGMALAASLSAFDLTQVWHLAAISFVTGMGMAFYYPAYSAWLPALVPEEDLLAVNGFEGMVRPAIGQAIGPGVAGVIVGSANPAAAFVVAASASAAALLALTFVPRPPCAATSTRHRTGTPSPRHCTTWPRASATWSARPGSWPPCCSPP